MDLAERLKYILKQRGLTQKKLSEMTGIPPSSIVDILKSRAEPKIGKMRKIASALNIDLNWLIMGVVYNPAIQEQELWRVSDGVKEGYTDTRSARHIRVIMNACAMSKEQFAEKLGINLNTLEYYLEHGIPESKIILDIIELGRKADLPIDLKWFVTGTGNK